MGRLSRSGDENTALGEMLVRAELISQADLDAAVAQQLQTGDRLVNILIAKGALDSRKFIQFLEKHRGSLALDVHRFDIDADVLALLPRELALAHEMVPIDRLRDVLTLASLRPPDPKVVASIEETTGLRVKVLICPAEIVLSSLQRYYEDVVAKNSAANLEGPLKLGSAVSMLRQVESLPALPGTVHKVREMLYTEEGSAAEVAEVISRDPAIAARILRIANSPAYGFVSRVDNIQLAVTLLGLREIYTVVLSTAVLNLFEKSRAIDYVSFWIESMVCATLSTALARQFDRRNRTGIFSAGLLHDLGRVALAEVSPRQYQHIDKRLLGLELVAAEERVLGLTHTEAGYELALHWDLPLDLAETIRFHHTPEFAREETRSVVSLVNIADVVSRAHRRNAESREPDFEECQASLDYLGITEEQVLNVFRSVPSPDAYPALWSPN